MSYLQVLLLVLPAVALLAWAPGRVPCRSRRSWAAALAVVGAVALVWTVPWELALLARGTWTYGPGRVLARLDRLPVEELALLGLQVALVGLWTARLAPPAAGRPLVPAARVRGALGWIAAAVAGAALVAATPHGLYAGALLLWAGLPLALQAAVGGDVLREERPRRLIAVVVPALLLCLLDRLAIAAGVWRLAPDLTLGWTVAGLPVEEGLFFALTCRLVADSLLLLASPLALARVAGAAGRLRACTVPGARRVPR